MRPHPFDGVNVLDRLPNVEDHLGLEG